MAKQNPVIPKIYKCPGCGAEMRLFALNDMWTTRVCEICGGSYTEKTKKDVVTLKIGNTEIIADNIIAANILKRSF
jgi:transcription elongation factor Elf1